MFPDFISAHHFVLTKGGYRHIDIFLNRYEMFRPYQTNKTELTNLIKTRKSKVKKDGDISKHNQECRDPAFKSLPCLVQCH